MKQRELFEEPTEEEKKLLSIIPIDAGDGRELTVDRIRFLITWSRRYGLDPFAGHAILMYGKPFVTADGAIAWAKKQKEYKGHSIVILGGKTKVEEGFREEDIVAKATVYIEGYQVPIVDYGDIKPEEIEEAKQKYGSKALYLPLIRHSVKMAMAKAIRRALKRAFPLFPVEE